jgi:hypothetical protein
MEMSFWNPMTILSAPDHLFSCISVWHGNLGCQAGVAALAAIRNGVVDPVPGVVFGGLLPQVSGADEPRFLCDTMCGVDVARFVDDLRPLSTSALLFRGRAPSS